MKCGRIVVPSNAADGLTKGDIIYYMPDVAETYDSYTKLLAHFDGTTGDKPTPATTGQTITYVSGAAVSSVQKKFGSASLLLNGSSDYITVPDSDDWTFGTGAFTIEAWIRFSALPGVGAYQAIFSHVESGSKLWSFFIINSGGTHQLYMYQESDGSTYDLNITWNCAANFLADTWYHVAIVRSGNNWYAFKDGVPQDSTGSSSIEIVNFAGPLYLGTRVDGGLFNGYIDEPRISKGIARWTADFSADLPATAYPNAQSGGGLVAAVPKGWRRLPIGTSGQTLKVSADGIPAWTT